MTQKTNRRTFNLTPENLERREMMTANLGGDFASIPIDEPQAFLGAHFNQTPTTTRIQHHAQPASTMGTAGGTAATPNNQDHSGTTDLPAVLGQAADTPLSGQDDVFGYCGNEKWVGTIF